MDHDFEKMLDTYTGKVKLAYMREALTGSAPADSRVIRPFEQLKKAGTGTENGRTGAGG